GSLPVRCRRRHGPFAWGRLGFPCPSPLKSQLPGILYPQPLSILSVVPCVFVFSPSQVLATHCLPGTTASADFSFPVPFRSRHGTRSAAAEKQISRRKNSFFSPAPAAYTPS